MASTSTIKLANIREQRGIFSIFKACFLIIIIIIIIINKEHDRVTQLFTHTGIRIKYGNNLSHDGQRL
jgi:uncharacterized integral membrane protein